MVNLQIKSNLPVPSQTDLQSYKLLIHGVFSFEDFEGKKILHA